MGFYGDVYETIIDGVSGINPSGNPVAIFVGTCSKGAVGNKYIIGKSSDLDKLLGKGNLVERIQDFFTKAPSDAVIIAIPSAKDIAGHIGNITKTGTGVATATVQGNPNYDSEVTLEIVTTGEANIATCRYSIDGGDSYSETITIPINGELAISDTGIKIVFSNYEENNSFVAGDKYTFKATSPKSSLNAIMNALEVGLESYTPRFCYIAQGVDNVYRAALGVKIDELFEAHRPTYVVTEAILPDESETIDDYVNRLVTDKQNFSNRFVVTVASFGEIIDASGSVFTRNAGGIVAGLIAKARVNQSIGEVASFPISNVKLPEGWTEAHSKTLDDSGYIVLRKYAGLSSLYISNGRTMADSTSDYQFIEVVDTVFKAIRLARIACLKNLQGSGDKLGIAKISADIETALATMTKAFPKELDSFKVIIPDGQDIVNNGLSYELELYGIPIVRKISLYFKFKYANPFEE